MPTQIRCSQCGNQVMVPDGAFSSPYICAICKRNQALPTAPPATAHASSSKGTNAPANSVADQWFYVSGGKKCGPVSTAQLQELAARGELRHSDMVLRHGDAKWMTAGSVHEVFPPPATAGRPDLVRLLKERRVLVASVAGGLVAFMLIMVACIALVVGGRGKQGQQAFVGTSGSSRNISGIKNEQHLEGAVGMVVCGLRVTGPDGTQVESWRSSPASATGSCFAISEDGYLLTNKHVVEKTATLANAELLLKKLREDQLLDVKPTVWVFFGKGNKYLAEIRYLSDDHDLAILKINRKHRPFLALAASDKAARGTKVVACGFPAISQLALGKSEEMKELMRQLSPNQKIEAEFKPRDFEFVMTSGTISRVTSEEDQKRTWVQHDASINPGSSGGPLLDDNGTVLGINTLGIQGTGTFYSLSISQLRKEIEKHTRDGIWK